MRFKLGKITRVTRFSCNELAVDTHTFPAMELVIYEIVCHRPFHAPFRFVEFKETTATKCKRTTMYHIEGKKGHFHSNKFGDIWGDTIRKHELKNPAIQQPSNIAFLPTNVKSI